MTPNVQQTVAAALQLSKTWYRVRDPMSVHSWYNDDNFWITWAPYLFSSERVRDAYHETSQILRLVGAGKQSRVLDLCCGPGRRALALTRQGHSVVGVDRMRQYLNEARHRSLEAGLGLHLICADIRQIELRPRFDFAINMFTSFGYFEREEEDLATVRNVWRSLKAGGIFVIETEGKEIMARDFREREWFWHEDGTIGVHERKVLDCWARMQTNWMLLRDDKLVWKGTVVSRIYSAVEMIKLLLCAGCSKVVILGNLDGAPYDQHASRMVAVATK